MSNKKANSNRQANYYNAYSTAQKANLPINHNHNHNNKAPLHPPPASSMHENLSPPVSPIQHRLHENQ